ncbi:MAG TPA: PQQ-binding-like beta-propeller repeat protein [Candidatus Limnocylindrales bacterium]|nr:PQQ-binding-like beta-propeller repeat protein [Candidatus Limnocylindrales bacterium]
MRKSLAVLLAAASVILLSASAVGAREPEAEEVTATSNASRDADWRQFRGGAAHRGVNRYETQLSTTTVGGMELQFVTNQGFNSSPAIANGVMYVSNGGLHAYPADCGTGGATCSPLWRGNSGGANWSSPAIGDGAVYISGDAGLSAYRVGCRSDGGVCSPLWRDSSAQAHFTSPTYADGDVYLGTNNGWLQVYNAKACNDAGGSCSPKWKAHVSSGLAQSSPAVADGIVYIGGDDGFLNAFKVDCATGGATCDPIWRGNIHGDTVASPAVGGGVVYIGTHSGQLFAFPTSCRTTGPDCDPLWTATFPGILHQSVAVTDTAVYVGAHRRLYAFAVGCGSNGEQCDPMWKSPKLTGGSNLASSPAVANGVVYIGTQAMSHTNGRLLAFPAECDGPICYRLWRSPLLGGLVNSSPAVAHGMVYVSSNGGQTFAFGLP